MKLRTLRHFHHQRTQCLKVLNPKISYTGISRLSISRDSSLVCFQRRITNDHKCVHFRLVFLFLFNRRFLLTEFLLKKFGGSVCWKYARSSRLVSSRQARNSFGERIFFFVSSRTMVLDVKEADASGRPDGGCYCSEDNNIQSSTLLYCSSSVLNAFSDRRTTETEWEKSSSSIVVSGTSPPPNPNPSGKV